MTKIVFATPVVQGRRIFYRQTWDELAGVRGMMRPHRETPESRAKPSGISRPGWPHPRHRLDRGNRSRGPPALCLL